MADWSLTECERLAYVQLIKAIGLNNLDGIDQLTQRIGKSHSSEFAYVLACEKIHNADMRSWRRDLVRRLAAPGRFARGGDRSSQSYKAKKIPLLCDSIPRSPRLPLETMDDEEKLQKPDDDKQINNIDILRRTRWFNGQDDLQPEGVPAAADQQALEVALLEYLVHERENSIDRWKARKAQSAEFMAGVRERLRDRAIAHLELRPVYLGHCAAYCDHPDVITTGKLR